MRTRIDCVAGLATILVGLHGSAEGQPTSLCANPADYTPTLQINANVSCSAYGAILPALTSPSMCNQPFSQSSPTTNYRQLIWTAAPYCCSGGPATSYCGTYQTVCNSTVQFNHTSFPFDDTQTTCAHFSASLLGQLLANQTTCDSVDSGGSQLTTQTLISLAAMNGCCAGGLAAQNTICGPPPVQGQLCASPSDFMPNAPTFAGSATCRDIQESFTLHNIFGNESKCRDPFPGGQNFTIGAAFGTLGAQCCQGARMAGNCSAERVLPCSNPADFNVSANLTFSPDDAGMSCAFAPLTLTGANASNCDQQISSGGTTYGHFLRVAGQHCCNGGSQVSICTAAPTPPPSPPPPRVGPTFACGGVARVYSVGTQCIGAPIDVVNVSGPCGSAPAENGGTE